VTCYFHEVAKVVKFANKGHTQNIGFTVIHVYINKHLLTVCHISGM